MSKDTLTPLELKEVLLAVAEEMIGSVDILTEADRMGDGDHGTGMKRGFTAVKGALIELPETVTIEDVFSKTGMSLMMKVGGASGAIFGTLFRSMGKRLSGESELNSAGLAAGMATGLEDVQKRGNSKPGDKTMIDALAPAVEAAQKCAAAGSGISSCLEVVVKAAEEGKEQTKEMVATTGKAKTLGERTIGHVDPGALSMTIIFRVFAEKVSVL